MTGKAFRPTRLAQFLREQASSATVVSAAVVGSALMAANSFAQEERNMMLEEVIVTSAATRLQSGFESPKPVTTVSREQLDARGLVNVADFLNEIPSFTGSATPASTTLSSSLNGANLLDLRGLGPNRTLVLVDRRRFTPTNDTGVVNLNVIPQALIKNVEVVTGGASAQWGSDAVAGVVNLQLDRNFEGVKVDTRYGQAGEGDAETDFLSLAFGVASEDGRSHLVVGGDMEDHAGVMDQSDRDWGRERWGVVGNPLDTGPNDGIPARLITRNVVLGLGTAGGYLPLALGNHPAVAQTQFGPNGEWLPYDIGEFPAPGAFAALPFQVGGDGDPFGDPASLSAPYDRKSLMAIGSHDLTENITVFAEASWGKSNSRNDTVLPWSLIGGGPDVIAADNPFIPEPVQQVMAENSIPQLIMGRSNRDHGPIISDTSNETTRFLVGLEGEFREHWSWEVSAATGKTEARALQFNNVITANRNAAIDAVRDPATGEIVCRANVGGANGAPGCVPMNLFGDGAPSQEALDYIHGTATLHWDVRQKVVAGSMSGELMELPAGPLALAFGAEYREESSSTISDKTAEEGGYFITNVVPLEGEYDVSEVFLELGAPLLATGNGMRLDVNAAARYTDYSTSGGENTWQFGATFSPYSDLTFRGTVSRDIRAPNIGELFQSSRLFFQNLTDPFGGGSKLIQVPEGGNTELTPEQSDTVTFGAVYQPAWLQELSLSADWYKIEIDDAIGALPAQTIVDTCFETGALCELVTLQDGELFRVQENLVNIAQRNVEGVDLEAVYTPPDVLGGAVSIRWLASYVKEQSFSPDGVNVEDDAGVVGPDAAGRVPTPKWRWNLSGNYQRGPLGLTAQLRYVGGGDFLANQTIEDINDNDVDDVYYVNLSARYDVPFGEDGNVQVYAGVNNVFDEDPPVAPLDFVNNLGTNNILYDVIGRYFFGGVRLRF
ncbi:TonB-dependent receptor domain-containing protein [Kineobactrum salinum]|uniref:TonB-dependent receptor n=1 Tax=Kineobactrum salinum TaxID=2708301 RepID=A0A6C0TXN5_9GAMM|nr:TonB-dependent receptor [Kineobactrum salinum]QIB64592.1 TonB-dependent receptor [Kineobactrum salinum]